MANKHLIIDADYPLEQKVLALLVCTAQEITSEMTKSIKPLGLSLTQLQILHSLCEVPEGRLTVNQIKKVMIEDSPNVSRSLNKLMDNGHIVKERNLDDQRVVHISVTESGRKIHVEADKLLMQSGARLNLNTEEQEQLYNLLAKM
jgi:DNA-binding MarR family transcriptional regulator